MTPAGIGLTRTTDGSSFGICMAALRGFLTLHPMDRVILFGPQCLASGSGVRGLPQGAVEDPPSDQDARPAENRRDCNALYFHRMYLCICICIYGYIHLGLYIMNFCKYMYTHIHNYTCTYTMNTSIYIHIYIYIYASIDIYTIAYVHDYIYIYIYMYVDAHICVSLYLHIYKHTYTYLVNPIICKEPQELQAGHPRVGPGGRDEHPVRGGLWWSKRVPSTQIRSAVAGIAVYLGLQIAPSRSHLCALGPKVCITKHHSYTPRPLVLHYCMIRCIPCASTRTLGVWHQIAEVPRACRRLHLRNIPEVKVRNILT